VAMAPSASSSAQLADSPSVLRTAGSPSVPVAEPRLRTVPSAEYCRVKPRKLWDAARRGEIAYYRLAQGAPFEFTIVDLNLWLKRHRVEAVPTKKKKKAARASE
jgi:hypothetical protein